MAQGSKEMNLALKKAFNSLTASVYLKLYPPWSVKIDAKNQPTERYP